MSALGWLFLVLLALLAAVLLVTCWRQDLEIQRLTEARHAKPRERGTAQSALPDGAAPADPGGAGAAPADPEDDPPFRDDKTAAHAANAFNAQFGVQPPVFPDPGPAPDSLEWHAETAAAAHANKMHEISKPYLPDTPPPIRLDRPAVRREVPGHPPWTGSQPALTEAMIIERDRQRVIRAELEALGDDPTESGVGRVMAMARALPASGAAGPEIVLGVRP